MTDLSVWSLVELLGRRPRARAASVLGVSSLAWKLQTVDKFLDAKLFCPCAGLFS